MPIRRFSFVPSFASVLVLIALAATSAAPAHAQPFGSWLILGAPAGQTYVEIPHSPALNTTTGFTFEAWIAVDNTTVGADCRSIGGKNYLTGWWVGVCNVGGKLTLRSYVKGSASPFDQGVLVRGAWQHVAVVYDKAAGRQHYINGLLVGHLAETGNLPTNTSALRIGSDVQWPHTPDGAIDEVRLWKIARTEAQIRQSLNQTFNPPKPVGLIGEWSLNGNGKDRFNQRNGTVVNGSFLTFPAGPPCTAVSAPAARMCLDNRFTASVSLTTPDGVVLPYTAFATNGTTSAIFGLNGQYWEVLVQHLDGCHLNTRHWFFASGLATNGVQVTVFDTKALQQKVYFLYALSNGVIPSIVDTEGLTTCP